MKEEVVFDGINIPQRPLAVARVIDVAIVEILWRSDLRVSKVMPRIDVHKRARTVDMALDKQADVNRMKNLRTIPFVSLAVHIHLCRMQKSKLKRESFVFLINTIRCDVSFQHSVQMFIIAICQSKKKRWCLPEAFYETRLNRETSTLEWEVLVASFLHIFFLYLTERIWACRGFKLVF